MVLVEVLCTNGHRVKVNCTPNTSLRQILEEACNRKGLLPVDNYGLKYNGKVLDLSQPFRYTGLINNSKVEMVKVEQTQASLITVAVQVESGERIQLNVAPTATLSEVFEAASRSTPETADLFSSASHPDLTPVAVHLHEEVIGAFCLSHTSLKSLGLTHGRAVLRFLWRKDAAEAAAAAEKALRARLSSASASRPAVNEAASVAPAPTGGPGTGQAKAPQNAANQESFSWFWDPPKAKPQQRTEVVSQFDHSPFRCGAGPPDAPLMNFKFPEETAGKNLYKNELSTKEIKDAFRCDRRPIWFSPSQTATSPESESCDPLPDSFFELTEEDVKKMMNDLRQRVINETESPLMTASMRTASRLAKYSKYNHAVIRFVFHDGVILQALFHPQETTYHLYKFIRQQLAHSKFILYTTPPKNVLKDGPDTLVEVNLVPLSRVYIGGNVEASGAVARPDVKLSSEMDAKEVVMDCLKAIDVDTRQAPEMSNGPRSPPTYRDTVAPSCSQSAAKNKTVPKWFKTN